ncbi:MAG: damage-inducible protein [Alphaproteobacteria bacterium PA4]|nr:MAG: damage-inducible protein [Alphaproteobacteria bacterium PA4]
MEQLFAQARDLAALLIARRHTLAVAESSTGGLISAALLSVPGASAYYLGGAVVYTPRARHRLLDLKREDVRGLKSASEPYAALLAERVRHRFSVTWGIAETGASGPNGNPYGDPAGHSCLAVAGPRPAVQTLATGNSDRAGNMLAFASAALALLHAQVAATD